ncbi:cellulase family glycosylhydrolase [Rhizobium sp. FY34]|uniref:cellulase family glycosylhydrolase n=1 Tax=Rhizobium sp. FY34 TaxID=2562309 RepID=UPI0010C06B7B|nr:cellulase family glycosylhydrolase [Rhizobium sp. FY34]
MMATAPTSMATAVRIRLSIVASLATLLAAGGTADGKGLPAPGEPPLRGVQIHPTDRSNMALDLVREAGFNMVRTGFYWYSSETAPDSYVWAAYDRLVARLNRRGLRVMFTLYGQVKHYGDDTVPRTNVQIAAFARWAAAAARRYRNDDVIWEIWNEPNLPRFWQPQPSAAEYQRLVEATCAEIRKTVPKATIVGGALAGATLIPENFFGYARSLDSAAFRGCLDGLTIHPYRDGPPETVSQTYDKLASSVKGLPRVLSGEWGYTTTGQTRVDEERQAEFAVRSFQANAAAGIPLSVWYMLRDRVGEQSDRETGFGLLKADLGPKPAYRALSVSNRMLSGLSFEGVCGPTVQGFVALTHGGDGGRRVISAWTLGAPGSLVLDTGVVAGPMVMGDGQDIAVDPTQSRTSVPLSGLPVYVPIRTGVPVSCGFHQEVSR